MVEKPDDNANGSLVEDIPVNLIQGSAKITNLEVEENQKLIIKVISNITCLT